MSQKTLVALTKKVFSLALIFNSIVSLISSLSILYSQYLSLSRSYFREICFTRSLLFWFIALTSTLNIAPAKILGKVNIRRILFHHYVYGFLSISIYIFSSIFFYLLHTFNPAIFEYYEIQNNQSYMILILYWGITLIIDDVSDISPRIMRLLNHLKRGIHKINGVIMKVHLISSFISICTVLYVFLWYIESILLVNDYLLLDFAHVGFMVNLFITAFYGIKISKERIWVKHF